MALSFVLDTSVVKRLGRPEVREVVEPLALGGQLGRPRICDLEVGYSARNADEWDLLVGSLDAFDALETTAAHVNRALQVQRLLATRRQRGRKIPDLLVAAAAEELGIPVLHYDADFDLIASVTGQLCRWVVPAGSIE
ncbi:VapC toxin family PIN domain ribonuclease [Mycobacterium persicum]|uniref:Ribonuclease VapC n=1 Tax=Mycobacterium persicum TaxID=1487726 RepID=A0A8E2ITM3_9MYCO|nr:MULTISPECIES: PIN domain nuclease [Mycobacterium]KZS84670.1 toxin [Mycobacterium persicum]ORB56623.1 VapC toxin family PIN domain ribonuclease [Mycobacterium persicum]ORB96843.1 VapC toxin family PIN domain ribonuclease [Mycobacterium persicum]ORC09010.1 VapC toxin family PIN domain ribonuclease [Mycobacterium persicum]ORC13209.1 VapC toxin family PIN domain ribonuclease [Mycobacterium kansasii]